MTAQTVAAGYSGITIPTCERRVGVGCRHRWKVERCLAWMMGHYDPHRHIYRAFGLVAIILFLWGTSVNYR